jgi:hypothetical protein
MVVPVLFCHGARQAGYEKYRRDFAKLIWQLASPRWDFDDATFDRSAVSFDNPDHVSIVIHNYRWRLGLAEGEPQYDDLERRLAEGPVISVPTITSKVMPMVRHTRTRVPMPRNSRADMRTGSSRVASGTTCLKKRPKPLPKPSSRSTVIDGGAIGTSLACQHTLESFTRVQSTDAPSHSMKPLSATEAPIRRSRSGPSWCDHA